MTAPLWIGRHRARRLLIALGIVVAVSATAAAKPDITKLERSGIEVASYPIADFLRSDPSRTHFGRLEWRGGVVLSSPSSFFGGLSGLALSADGRELIAVSDAGSWLRARIAYRDARPAGLEEVEIGPLLALKGKPLARNADRDAEAVTLASGSPGNGELLVAFEQNRRIGRFPAGEDGIGAPTGYLTLPPEVRRLASNKSLESVAVLASGRLKGSAVLLGERGFGGADGDVPGWIVGTGKPAAFTFADMGGFDVTDVASLPDGGVVVLERRFRWTEGVKMRIRRVSAQELEAGGRIAGEVLIVADQSHAIDNMEGIAVHRGKGGETILTLVSDDNFSPLQRTLLLQFAIADTPVTQ